MLQKATLPPEGCTDVASGSSLLGMLEPCSICFLLLQLLTTLDAVVPASEGLIYVGVVSLPVSIIGELSQAPSALALQIEGHA